MKRIITLIILGVTCYAHAQNKGRVGINTSTPRATLDVSRVDPTTLPAGQAQGVSIPNMTSAERAAFVGVEHGTLIYNIDKKCTEIYEINGGNGEWHCLPAVGSVHTQTITVVASGFEGSFFTGGVTPSNKVKFTINNNTPVPMTAVDFSNSITIQNPYSGTLQVQPGQNTAVNIPAGGSYVLSYTFTGTPAQGTLKATFNYGRLNASQSVEIRKSPEIENVKRYIASMVYLTQNIKGEINNTKKLTIKIPWKNGEGPFEAVSVTKQTHTGAGLGGDVNNITLNIPAGDFGTTAGASGELTATFTVDGDGVYKVDQKTNTEWDIITFPVTLNGKTFNVLLKGVSGIPDRCFNKTNKECAGGHAWLSNDYDHQFVYMPITLPDGRVWLNNVLGAVYSNIESPYANPIQKPTSRYDYKGYGSMFQWQRKADGHEVIKYDGNTSVTTKRGSINYSDLVARGINPTWTNPGTDLSIGFTGNPYYSWNNGSLSEENLWKAGGANNPCPLGYHVPNYNDMLGVINALCPGAPTQVFPPGGISAFGYVVNHKCSPSEQEREKFLYADGSNFTDNYPYTSEGGGYLPTGFNRGLHSWTIRFTNNGIVRCPGGSCSGVPGSAQGFIYEQLHTKPHKEVTGFVAFGKSVRCIKD